MSGGGSRYERFEREPLAAEQFLLDVRKEKIDRVVSQRTRNFTVVLDRLEDSFNMAAVLRTCESMGVQEVHVVINPEAPFLPNSRVAQGCDKWLDVHQYKSFGECREHLKARGFSIYASALREGATSLYSLRFDTKFAMVFGNERQGVSDDVLAAVDGTFWVPMRGFSQSLNISAAASACVSRAIAWRDEHLGASGDLPAEDAAALRDRFYQLAIKQRKRLFKATQR
ncbi:RNA methyltransferase [Myxococcaceae bacterium JPH2]|nr:RNA methyltransferase [Myxococcaceae bacterium JPH2]